MAQYTASGFKTQQDSRFADNSNNDIDEADLRAVFEDVADSAPFLSDTNTWTNVNTFQENIIKSETFTTGGTDDYGIAVTDTLNDTGAAGGSDVYRALKVDITETDTTGWDNVYLMDLLVGSSSYFNVDNTGAVTSVQGGTFGSGTTGTIAVSIDAQDIADTETRSFKADAIHNSVTRNSEIGVYTHSGITNACAFMLLDQEDGNASYLWVDNPGNLRISSTQTHIGTTSGTVVGTQTSDERFKENLRDVPYGLNEILSLPTYQYERNGITEIGFGAQSTKDIIPEAVYDTNEGIDGEDQSKYAMDYARIIPVLVNAIKELNEKIS